MNEKKDDSEGRNNNLSDTAELLESLFKDTKDSRIKLVRRKTRPKSRMKKRVVSKQRKESVKKTSKTPVLKQGRPSEPERRSGPTKEKTRFRKASHPGSKISKGSEIKPSSIQRATAHTRPTSTIRKDDSEKASKTDVLKKRRGLSMKSAGRTEDKAAIPETSALDPMVSTTSETGLRESKVDHRLSAEERPIPKDEEAGVEIFFDRVDQKGDAPADHEGLAEADEEITEVLDKSGISSMISSLEASGEEAQRTPSAEKGSVPEDKEGEAEIVFDRVDQEGDAPADHEGLAEGDEEITEVMDKSGISSMISSLEASGEEAQRTPLAEEDSIPEDEKKDVETDVEPGAPEKRPFIFSRIGLAGKEELVTQEERASSGSIGVKDSVLKESRPEAYSESTPEEKAISEDKEEGEESLIVTDEEERLHDQAPEEGTGVEEERDSVDQTLKEERPVVFSKIGVLGKEEPLSDENGTASSSIGGEDSLLKVREPEAYSESTPEEKAISEDKEEGEDSLIVTDEEERLRDQAPEEGTGTKEERDGVDRTLKEERPSDPAGIVGAAEEEPLFHEEPAASSSIAIEDSLLKASENEADPESAFKPPPTLGPLDDSLAGAGEQDFHHRQAAEDEPMLTDGGGDIQKALRLQKSREDEPSDLEECIEELMGEIQSLRSSVRRAMLVKVVLPLVLFAILALILSIWLMPLDSSKGEEAQEMAKEEMVETPKPKKRDIAPETLKKEESVDTSTPKKGNTPSEISPETVTAVEQDVEPTNVAGKTSYRGF